MYKIVIGIVVALSVQSVALLADAPGGMVSFVGLPTTNNECPKNWQEAQYAQNRAILGTTNAKYLQYKSGRPFKNAESFHLHVYKGNALVPKKHTSSASDSNRGITYSGNHPLNGVTNPTQNTFPFVQYLVCERQKNTTGNDTLPFGSVAFFNLSKCPNNWSPFEAANGRFIVTLMAGGKIGYTTQEAWSNPLMEATHDHSLSTEFFLGVKSITSGAGASTGVAGTGAALVSAMTGSKSNQMPFVTLMACEKSASLSTTPPPPPSNDQLPKGISVFYAAQNCPSNWGNLFGAPGRIIVGTSAQEKSGLAFGGMPLKPNETSRSHTHTFSGKVLLAEKSTDLISVIHDFHVGKSGNYGFHGTTYKGVVSLPYTLTNACTYLGKQSTQ